MVSTAFWKLAQRSIFSKSKNVVHVKMTFGSEKCLINTIKISAAISTRMYRTFILVKDKENTSSGNRTRATSLEGKHTTTVLLKCGGFRPYNNKEACFRSLHNPDSQEFACVGAPNFPKVLHNSAGRLLCTFQDIVSVLFL